MSTLLFAQTQAKADGTSQLIASLNFTHAEEVFPLATLLGCRAAES